MYTEQLKDKLKYKRKKAGYTQEEAAKELGIARSTLANYEIGRNEPDLETLGKIAELYKMSIDWLLGTGNGN